MKNEKYKLNIELVPQSAWGLNLRKLLNKKGWDILRKRVYSHYGYKCCITGERGEKHPVECHEVWEWNKETKTYYVVKLEALHPSVHLVKHFGLAQKIGKDKEAKELLQKVNGFSKEQVEKYIMNCFLEWNNNNKIEWKLDLEKTTKFLKENWDFNMMLYLSKELK